MGRSIGSFVLAATPEGRSTAAGCTLESGRLLSGHMYLGGAGAKCKRATLLAAAAAHGCSREACGEGKQSRHAPFLSNLAAQILGLVEPGELHWGELLQPQRLGGDGAADGRVRLLERGARLRRQLRHPEAGIGRMLAGVRRKERTAWECQTSQCLAFAARLLLRGCEAALSCRGPCLLAGPCRGAVPRWRSLTCERRPS